MISLRLSGSMERQTRFSAVVAGRNRLNGGKSAANLVILTLLKSQ